MMHSVAAGVQLTRSSNGGSPRLGDRGTIRSRHVWKHRFDEDPERTKEESKDYALLGWPMFLGSYPASKAPEDNRRPSPHIRDNFHFNLGEK